MTPEATISASGFFSSLRFHVPPTPRNSPLYPVRQSTKITTFNTWNQKKCNLEIHIFFLCILMHLIQSSLVINFNRESGNYTLFSDMTNDSLLQNSFLNNHLLQEFLSDDFIRMICSEWALCNMLQGLFQLIVSYLYVVTNHDKAVEQVLQLKRN